MSPLNPTPFTLLHLLTDIAYHTADSLIVDLNLNQVRLARNTHNDNSDNPTEYHHSDETIITTTDYTPDDIFHLHHTYPDLIATVVAHNPKNPLKYNYLINKLSFQPSLDDALEQVHKNLDPSFVSKTYISMYTFN